MARSTRRYVDLTAAQSGGARADKSSARTFSSLSSGYRVRRSAEDAGDDGAMSSSTRGVRHDIVVEASARLALAGLDVGNLSIALSREGSGAESSHVQEVVCTLQSIRSNALASLTCIRDVTFVDESAPLTTEWAPQGRGSASVVRAKESVELSRRPLRSN